MKLSILIPIYNEPNTIRKLISTVRSVDIGPVEKEIIVVDDGSTDGTREVLKTIPGILLLFHRKNRGKGAAIRTALHHATGDMIIVQDADLEYDPFDYPSLVQPIIEGKSKVVYGSRRLRSTNKQHSGFSFYLGGKALTFITNILYGSRITDEPTCYKVFRADILQSIALECDGFSFCPEITAKTLRLGHHIHEVPISYYPRSVSEGKKIRWRDGFHAVWTLLKYRVVSGDEKPYIVAHSVYTPPIMVLSKNATSTVTEQDNVPVVENVPSSNGRKVF